MRLASTSLLIVLLGLLAACGGDGNKSWEEKGDALAESGEHDPVNIGNPDEYTLLQLAEAVIEVTGAGSELVYEALPVDDPKVRQPDIARARELLGWEPKVPLHDGLRRTCLLYTSPSPRDLSTSRMPSSA